MTQAPFIDHCDRLSRGGTCHFAGRRAFVICPRQFQALARLMKEKRMTIGSERRSLQDLLHDEMIDSIDEELELEIGDELLSRLPSNIADETFPADTIPPIDRRRYFSELLRLQRELVKLQNWVVHKGLKVVILFEGRDAAGKGGVIKRVVQRLNPRICRTVALSAPTERERSQWYFQRYATHLPGAGEIVLFDRSWYNRAGVERVMGFCTEDDVQEFFRSAPEFERMLVRSGIILIKYWFSITDEQQNLRFLMRIHDPLKQWKLSPMDLESRRRWEEYTKAKEEMLERTHIPEARWWVIEGNDKKRARLNCIHHLLQQIPYSDVEQAPIALPERARKPDYLRRPVPAELHVPDVY
jgi:polyphosphate kinase 2